MKNEQQAIEEMTEDMADALTRIVRVDEDGNTVISCDKMAAVFYRKGYHKQMEGEWETIHHYKLDAFSFYSHICKVEGCGYFYKDVRLHGYKFCPNCGARMKGGAE